MVVHGNEEVRSFRLDLPLWYLRFRNATSGLLIDHLARRVRGSLLIVEGEHLPVVLRTLRTGDRVHLEFVSLALGLENLEYSGDAEPIMIRVRPCRDRVYRIIFVFKLLAGL